jgi:hypothetical protein
VPLISVETVVAANTVSDNVLSGQLYEFLSQPSVVTLFATGSATGLRTTFSIGGQLFVEEGVLNAQNRTPIPPDDLIVQEAGLAGERLVLKYRNTTAGSLTARTLIQINPLR